MRCFQEVKLVVGKPRLGSAPKGVAKQGGLNAQAATWLYVSSQAYLCQYSGPYWTKNHLDCNLSYSHLTATFAYDRLASGSPVWGQGTPGCGRSFPPGETIDFSWCGWANNGGNNTSHHMQAGLNGTFYDPVDGTSDFYLRLDCYWNGAIFLQGGIA
jgi:hypothetical protein